MNTRDLDIRRDIWQHDHLGVVTVSKENSLFALAFLHFSTIATFRRHDSRVNRESPGPHPNCWVHEHGLSSLKR